MKNVFEWDRADKEEKKSKLLQNFYRNLIIRNGCWGYKSNGKSKTYFQVEVGKRKYKLLHRLSWELHNGDIPEGMQINHRCHNPQCCRPSHLYLGTQQDNINDQVDRGSFVKGSKHGMSKINEEIAKDIKTILKSKKLTCKEIAEKFGISRDLVKDISRGKTWKHVIDDA